MLLLCILGVASNVERQPEAFMPHAAAAAPEAANVLGEPLDVPAHGLVEDAKEVAEKVLTELEIETHLDGFPALVLLVGMCPRVPTLELSQSLKAASREGSQRVAHSNLVLTGSGTALGLVVYYFITLSDLTEDLINPYTLYPPSGSNPRTSLLMAP